MLTELPIKLQMRVIQYLAADNFPQAKQLHDQWVSERSEKHNTISVSVTQ